MAEIKMKLLLDLKKMKSEIKKGFDDALGGGGGDKKNGKGTKNILSKIFGALAPLAVLLSLKPIVDLLTILTNFAALALVTVFKWLQKIDEGLRTLLGWVVEKLLIPSLIFGIGAIIVILIVKVRIKQKPIKIEPDSDWIQPIIYY